MSTISTHVASPFLPDRATVEQQRPHPPRRYAVALCNTAVLILTDAELFPLIQYSAHGSVVSEEDVRPCKSISTGAVNDKARHRHSTSGDRSSELERSSALGTITRAMRREVPVKRPRASPAATTPSEALALATPRASSRRSGAHSTVDHDNRVFHCWSASHCLFSQPLLAVCGPAQLPDAVGEIGTLTCKHALRAS